MGGGPCADSPYRELSSSRGRDAGSAWTFRRRLLKHKCQAQMPGKWSTERVFAHARHTAVVFVQNKSATCQSEVLRLTACTPTSDLAGQPGQGGYKGADSRNPLTAIQLFLEEFLPSGLLCTSIVCCLVLLPKFPENRYNVVRKTKGNPCSSTS